MNRDNFFLHDVTLLRHVLILPVISYTGNNASVNFAVCKVYKFIVIRQVKLLIQLYSVMYSTTSLKQLTVKSHAEILEGDEISLDIQVHVP